MLNGTKYFNMTYEVWVPALGFPNYYVNQFGDVKSVFHNKEHILVQCCKWTGYLYVYPFNKGKKNIRVNRLVLQSFTGKTGEGLHSHHIDKNKQNNCIWNLEWKDLKEHLQEHGKKGNDE